jgi:hypothetical protein
MHGNKRRLSGGEGRPTLAWSRRKQLHREEKKVK